MTESPPHPDSDGAADGDAEHESSAGTPRWVKAFGVITVALILLVLVLLIGGGGNHGPGRHTGSGDGDDKAAPASSTKPDVTGVHKPPPEGHEP